MLLTTPGSPTAQNRCCGCEESRLGMVRIKRPGDRTRPRPRMPKGVQDRGLAASRRPCGSSFGPARFRHLDDAGRHAVGLGHWRPLDTARKPSTRAMPKPRPRDLIGWHTRCPCGSEVPQRRPYSHCARRQSEHGL